MIWCAIDRDLLKETAVARDSRLVREGDEGERAPSIAPSMIYAYAALSARNSLRERRAEPDRRHPRPAWSSPATRGVPIAGKDFKTGQTLMKTILAPGLKSRLLGLERLVLDEHPRQPRRRGPRRSRVVQDQGGEQALRARAHPPAATSTRTSTGSSTHKVRINYYPPRGDNKEGWDNIDIFGWLGYPMQIKIDFLCRDTILAAPIVLDLALFMDLARRTGMRGNPGVALVLLQEPDARPRSLPGARSLHPAHEAQEHAPAHPGGGSHHASRSGVLRLRR